jgi:hypothetical protein
MKNSSVAVGLVLLGLLVLPNAWAAEEKGQEEQIALEDVPAAVLKAAEDAVKGITLCDVEKKTKGAQVVYEFVGMVEDQTWVITVSPEGKVLQAKGEGGEDVKKDKEEAGEKKKTDK